ncbi:MAG TPA: dsDNA nuclease domain-containing protein [Polyangiaceae bacterium]|nr:dsDNA nuclease domain-containing protein [Polyangiaceae bacterium]
MVKASFRTLAPLEQGGRSARDGFAYQDQITVAKCLDMFESDGPIEVWSEAEDDIVVVWLQQGVEIFEFVQVKGADIGQAWTVPRICSKSQTAFGATGPCIVDRSLAHDRGKENCRFRLVTKWQPHEDLGQLCVPFNFRGAIDALVGCFDGRNFGPSPNGNGVAFWLKNLSWEVQATQEQVRESCLLKLARFLEKEGKYLTLDQIADLHARLFARVQDAAVANPLTHRQEKQITREYLRAWLLEEVEKISNPISAMGVGPLSQKLAAAGIAGDSADAAKELRRKYLGRSKQVDQYLSLEGVQEVAGEMTAMLHGLMIRLESGAIRDSPKRFQARCLAELDKMVKAAQAQGKSIDRQFAYGCMYDVMNRCLHRLTRERP